MNFKGSILVGSRPVYDFSSPLPAWLSGLIDDAEKVLPSNPDGSSTKLSVSIDAAVKGDMVEISFVYPSLKTPGQNATFSLGSMPIPSQVALAVEVAENLGLPGEVTATASIS